MQTNTPVLIIGLDGVPLTYLNEFRESLPSIRAIRSRGICEELPSIHPPWTGSAWPSMYTGVDPSHHGVYDFFDYTNTYPDEAEVVSRQDVQSPAIWDYLSSIDYTSIVLNVPVTHPAQELQGVLIPGYMAPQQADGYPSDIRNKVSRAINEEYVIYSEHETTSESRKKIDGYENLIELRGKAAAHLLKSEEWDFAFIQVQKTDAVFHNSTEKQDFKRIFEQADHLVGRLIESCDVTPNVILCSDHGIGPVSGYTVYINEILRKHGYIQSTSERTSMDLKGIKREDEGGYDGGRLMGRIAQAGRSVGVTPGGAYRVAQRLGIENHLMKMVPDGIGKSLAEGVDWRQSTAYCRRGSEQGIRINLRGRDPHGIVPQNEYESVREEIIGLLSDLKTPRGTPVFEWVAPRGDVYCGSRSEYACDILFRTVEMNHNVSTKLYGTTFTEVDTYNHKRKGFFAASGPDFEEDWTGSLSLLDIAPLVFGLLDEPVPERFSGTVPDGILLSDVKCSPYNDVTINEEGYSQDQTEIKDRLSDLGYL